MKLKQYFMEKDNYYYSFERYEKLLKSHDWFYDRNSDHRAFVKGNENRKEFNHLYNVLGKEDKKKVFDMWNKYAPKEYKRKRM